MSSKEGGTKEIMKEKKHQKALRLQSESLYD